MKYAEVADSPDSNAFTNYFNVESKDSHYVLLANKTLTVLGSENANPGTYSEHVFSLGDHWSSFHIATSELLRSGGQSASSTPFQILLFFQKLERSSKFRLRASST